ncbi:MAG: fructose-6-phosphate aldolase [Candidatus Dependentiae bacterium]|nr:fructose-6-phosphate aldolase [Candidatus Dependentiae bacterium]
MKIFLDTAHLPTITQWLATGLIDGVTTNPTHLSKEGGDSTQLVKALCAQLGTGDVSIEITEHTPEKVYAQAQAIAALAPNVVVKIPCHKEYYGIIKQLVLEGISINITLVFSLMQGLMMCKLGVKYISPFVGRLDDIDVDGISVLHQLRNMIDQYHFNTQILAASLRDIRHLHAAIEAGADVATVPSAILEKAVTHPLTISGMVQFNADWDKLGIKQFP